MAVEFTGPQRRELREALLDAFSSWNALRMLTSDQLSLNLAVLTGEGSGIEANVFNLIEYMKERSLLGDLLIAARNQNPTNEKVQNFAEKVGVSAARGIKRAALEKVVSRNSTFLDVAKWRAQLTRAEWRVCRIDRNGDGQGTGFLVGPDLVLTNYHVVESLMNKPANFAKWSCRFDYKVNELGTISNGISVGFAEKWYEDHAPYSHVDTKPDPKPGDPTADELDYALIRIADRIGEKPVGKGEGGEERGIIELRTDAVDFDTTSVIGILQHPKTLPMKLSLGMDETIELRGEGRRIRYKTPTEEGSSGSPVFDSDWNLIALHHSGDPRLMQPQYNEAIPISLIAARPKVAAAIAQ